MPITTEIINSRFDGTDLLVINGNGKLTKEVIDTMKQHNRIMFGEKFTNSIDDTPDNVTYIYFQIGSAFNTKVKKFPKNIEKIEFVEKYNHPLDNFPPGMRAVTVSGRYNLPLNTLNEGLKELYIYSDNYTHDLVNLPPGLEKIVLGSGFRGIIKHYPVCLKNLQFSEYTLYDGSFDCLPEGIETIVFPETYLGDLKNIPASLKNITLHFTKDIIYPHGLESLKLISRYCFDNEDFNFEFPDSVKNLDLTKFYDYEYKFRKFPKNLIKIYITNYDYLLDNLPDGVKIIVVSKKYKYLKEIKAIYPNAKIYNKSPFNFHYTLDDEVYDESSDESSDDDAENAENPNDAENQEAINNNVIDDSYDEHADIWT